MNYKVIISPKSEREIKRLIKKYHSFKADLAELIELLQSQPQQGEPLGRDCYKIRLAIRAKSKGKSGGARVITCVKITKEIVVVMSVYDKSETASISDDELDNRLADLTL